MHSNSILIRDTACIEEILEGEIVLYCTKNSQAIYLNESAALIWQLINNKHTVSNIITLICDAYPEENNIQSDIYDTLNVLTQHGVIVYD